MATKHRLITSQPRAGQKIVVKTPTNIHAILEFASGAVVTLLTSWDVWSHGHSNMELYGTEGTLYVPDPNYFGGTLMLSARDRAPAPHVAWDHPFGADNQKDQVGVTTANYRSAGLADMADAIARRRDARCSLDRALHVVEIMTAILKSGETGKFVTLKTTCTQPKYLGPDEARALLA